jgi:hypothetical protein
MTVYVRSPEFYLDVARGIVAPATYQNVFGRNPNQNISSEDVWGNGAVQATWVPPTAARLHDISSSDANDNATGNGAHTIFIEGLDDDYVVQSEVVVLNGLSNVATTLLYRMINKMYVLTAGSSGSNVGAIKATAQTDGTVTSMILANVGQAQQAIYQVPADNQGYIYNLNASVQANTGANISIELLVQEFGAPFNQIYRVYMGVGPILPQIDFPIPIRVEEKAIIKVRANSNGNNSDISVGFTVLNLYLNMGV